MIDDIDMSYPIGILKDHRDSCNGRWSMSSVEIEETPFMKAMNELQEKRAEILDKAIAILEKEL